MSKRDLCEELADIERQIADKNPDAISEDMSYLAALGLADTIRKSLVYGYGQIVTEFFDVGESGDGVG